MRSNREGDRKETQPQSYAGRGSELCFSHSVFAFAMATLPPQLCPLGRARPGSRAAFPKQLKPRPATVLKAMSMGPSHRMSRELESSVAFLLCSPEAPGR